MHCLTRILLFLAVVLCGMLSGKGIDFNRDIRPILSDRCFQCHGPDENKRKGKFRLDDEASAKSPKKGVAKKKS